MNRDQIDVQRVARERDAYNQCLEREGYNKVLEHANRGPAYQREVSDNHKFMRQIQGKRVLEIGSSAWSDWIEFDNIQPEKLICINISEQELNRGINRCKERSLDSVIDFRLMDAHKLDFDDESFDFIFGSGILHHLDFNVALKEISRVLRPGGVVLFKEPLRANPVSVLVRWMTPKARTEDENPLGLKELGIINNYFDCKNRYYQLLMVPVGIVTRLVCSTPNNVGTKFADRIDIVLEKMVPFLRPFFRYVTIYGRKPLNRSLSN